MPGTLLDAEDDEQACHPACFGQTHSSREEDKETIIKQYMECFI